MPDRGNKTTASDRDVSAFVASVADDQRRHDAEALADLMLEVTGEPAVMWGSSIVGFGSRHYRGSSGREGDTAAVAFAPRKAQSVLYLTGGVDDYQDLLATLGPHQTGKGCLYVKRLDQVDSSVLRDIVARSYQSAAAD